jgi:GWxTD domain-containing protein
MSFTGLSCALALAAGVLPGDRALAQSTSDGLSVRPVRYYRAEGAGQTRVRTLIQVPLSFMDSAGGRLTYGVSVKVTDQAGIALHTDNWWSHAPVEARTPGAFGISVVDFVVAPGIYAITVQVRDSVSGKEVEATAPIEGFTGPPEASDLMLASTMRTADPQDTVPRPGEMRRGNTLFAAAATLRLTTLKHEAFYILEAYNEGAEQTGTMAVALLDETGKALLQTPPSAVRVASGGGLLKGRVPLEGLPPGQYTMKVLLTLGGRTTERSAPLMMAPLEETLQRDVQRISQEKVTDAGYFKYMDATALDTAFAPLVHIGSPAELKLWNKSMSEDAKRRFLTEFWQKRDQASPGGRNEARERFYGAIEFANLTYWEKKTPGWKTDRGRVFAKNGAPDELLHREQENRAPPYEVWKYARSGEWYIFADLTALDNWKLMTSSDLRENRIPDWRDRMGEDAVRDAGRFLSVDFYSGSTNY